MPRSVRRPQPREEYELLTRIAVNVGLHFIQSISVLKTVALGVPAWLHVFVLSVENTARWDVMGGAYSRRAETLTEQGKCSVTKELSVPLPPQIGVEVEAVRLGEARASAL